MNNSARHSTDPAGSTSASLLRRVEAHDQIAWVRLTQIYGPLVYRWCRRAQILPQDVADIGQDVFQAVATGIGKFRQEAVQDSFRGWLYGITRHKINDHFRRVGRRPRAIGGTEFQQHLGDIPLETGSTEAPPPDDATIVLHRAMALIRPEFDDHTWAAFWHATIEQHASPDIACELDMTANAVRQAKYRVLRRLRQELVDLEPP